MAGPRDVQRRVVGRDLEARQAVAVADRAVAGADGAGERGRPRAPRARSPATRARRRRRTPRRGGRPRTPRRPRRRRGARRASRRPCTGIPRAKPSARAAARPMRRPGERPRPRARDDQVELGRASRRPRPSADRRRRARAGPRPSGPAVADSASTRPSRQTHAVAMSVAVSNERISNRGEQSGCSLRNEISLASASCNRSSTTRRGAGRTPAPGSGHSTKHTASSKYGSRSAHSSGDTPAER